VLRRIQPIPRMEGEDAARSRGKTLDKAESVRLDRVLRFSGYPNRGRRSGKKPAPELSLGATAAGVRNRRQGGARPRP
jgi:hypothetical protein